MLYLLFLLARADDDEGTIGRLQRWNERLNSARKTIEKWLDVIENSKMLKLVSDARLKVVNWRKDYLKENGKIWEDHKRTARKVLEEWRKNPTNPSEQKNPAEGELPGQKDSARAKREFIPEI